MRSAFVRHLVWLLTSCLYGNTFFRLRAKILRMAGFDVHPTARIINSAHLVSGKISIGEDTFVGHEVFIAGGEIRIGKYCDLAPRVLVHGGSHEMGGPQRRAGKTCGDKIEVGDGTWIGTGAILIGGAKIGKGCIIAAGSLVRNEIPDNCLAAGVPAVVKKQLSET